jgi:hypothetical protein
MRLTRGALFLVMSILLAAAAAGCGGDDATIVKKGAWTWVDVPGSACDDGSATGFGVNGGSDDLLLIYFEGGGACWDATTCFTLNTAVHGPYGSAQWNARSPGFSGPFDRARAGNPFRNASWVYIPYCTGDLHAGSNVPQYVNSSGATVDYHHVGRTNTEAYLQRIRAFWPTTTRLVVSGGSAGGYGAALNYDLFRRAYPNSKAYLVDDSGPLLEQNSVPASERTAWFQAWNLGAVVDPLCSGCRDDLSAFYPALVAAYPNDRMALLDSEQDQVIRTYFMLMPADFQASLLATVHDRFDPTAMLRAFVIAGSQHVLLQGLDDVTSNGLTADAWLTQMIGDDAAWATQLPAN